MGAEVGGKGARRGPRFAFGVLVALLGVGSLVPARAADWPQWRGPARTGLSQETGLLKAWPEGGPKLVWKANGIGGGYTAPSIAGGRIYGMGYIGEDEVVWALDAATGKPVWKTPIAKANHDVGYNEGSRSTPTVDGAYIYLVGVSGDLVCLDRARGAIKWRKSLVKEFGGAIPGWGYTESPLIDGAKVIATPGGKDATLVALDKLTGNLIWKSQVPEGDPAHYSSCIQMTFGGVKQYVQFLKGGVVGVAAADGKFLWRYNHPANGTANISTPIYRDGTVFAASSYNTGGGLAKLTPSAGGFTAQEVYFTRQMKNHHGGMVLVGDYLYGFDENTLTCIKFATGDIAWTDRSVGKGSLTYVDGHLIARSERGPVALIEVNPQKYVEISRFEQPERSAANAWPHPVVANGRLYLRDQDLLLCYDVKGDAKPVQSAAK